MKRTIVLFLTLTMLLVLFAGSAYANRWDGFEATADCDGWTVEAAAKIGSDSAPYVEIPYLVTLSQNGSIVESFDGTVQAYFQMDSDAFELTETWTTELSGLYVVEGVFTLPLTTTGEPVMSFVYDLDCGGVVVEACNFTPGFWKNHPEAWPVQVLTLGDVSYDMAALMAILNTPVRGDATVITAYHLIASKLNVLNGSDDSIQDAIDAADDLLVTYPIFSRPGKRDKQALLQVKNELAGYNELGCDGNFVPSDLGPANKALNADSSWSDMKAQFR